MFFVCLCASFLVWFVFDVIAHWTLYWSITSAFEAIDELTALHANLQFIFFAAVEREGVGRKKINMLLQIGIN